MYTRRYELILNQGELTFDAIHQIFNSIFLFLKQGEVTRLIAKLQDISVRFFLEIDTKSHSKSLPLSLPELSNITILPGSQNLPNNTVYSTIPRITFSPQETLPEIIYKTNQFQKIVISGRKIGTWGIFHETLYAGSTKSLLWPHNFHHLVIDFKTTPYLLHTKRKKYLKLEKSLHLFSSDKANALVKVDTFPYFSGDYYLPLNNFDFLQHSLVVGATGSGKTKFLSHFIEQVNKKELARIVIIDPHDALRTDIGGLKNTQIFDFNSETSSIDLFDTTAKNTIVSTDVTLDLVKSILGSQYNSKLERLARSSIYLLIEKGEFNFQNLRKLLTDSVYRHQTLSSLNGYLPESIENFFGQDFNELKTASYNEAFAPLISFIDELQLLPVFYRKPSSSLKQEIFENNITLFSLNQSSLGVKAQKVLSGLILNQLFILMQQRIFHEHIILIIDEVAVIENPILVRFLSEARKFNVSVILASQYFAQITENLRQSIFANISNYFCFRVSYDDAALLKNHLNPSLNESTEADKCKLLSTLPARKACIRISANGNLGAAFLGDTLDFVSKPEPLKSFAPATINSTAQSSEICHQFTKSNANLFALMKENSTSRKKING